MRLDQTERAFEDPNMNPGPLSPQRMGRYRSSS
jgi:hypothetical protein